MRVAMIGAGYVGLVSGACLSQFGHYVTCVDNNVEKIADAIVSGTDMDLEKYNLDVLKEGVILHLLMYKHNLNFSNPINRLPNSTQQIHLLLSKNNRTGIENLYVS